MKQPAEVLLLFLVCLSITAGCSFLPPTPLNTPAQGMVNTLAAQTLQAHDGIYPVEGTPLVTPTSAPIVQDETPTPALFLGSTFFIPTPQAASPLSAPFLVAIPTQLTIPCNAAEFIKDVTIPDYSLVKPGQSFTKTWRLKNIGSCTWTPDYSMVMIWGHPMGTKPPIPIGQIVEPGQIVDLSIAMVAPKTGNEYSSHWMLQDTQGNLFGTGSDYKSFFWVAISVFKPGGEEGCGIFGKPGG